jgi:hypothetical protein
MLIQLVRATADSTKEGKDGEPQRVQVDAERVSLAIAAAPRFILYLYKGHHLYISFRLDIAFDRLN